LLFLEPQVGTIDFVPPFSFTILGTCVSGGIGQPLSLLLKINPLVAEVSRRGSYPDINPSYKTDFLNPKLSLYDIVNTPGVAADLSHIATPAKIEGYLPPEDGLKKTLQGADLVIIPAGLPRKPGVSSVPLLMSLITHRPS
jgi:malate dehydrogenase